MAQINTPAFNLDINPGSWAANELVQSLGGPGIAYMNLLGYATMLSATTGSKYVDGDFSRAAALVRVRHLADHFDTLVSHDLVEEVDGDQWHVDLWQTTSHEGMQAAADRKAARTATLAANKATKAADLQATQDKTDRKRGQARERQRKHRASQKPPPLVEIITESDVRDVSDEDLADMNRAARDYYEAEGHRYARS